MPHPPPDELLSAYLDGEANPTERAEVQRRLCDDPQARGILNDLNWLRKELGSLPQTTLPEDFCRRVIRAAEERVLIGKADDEPSLQQHAPINGYANRKAAAFAVIAPPVAPTAWRQRLRRPLAWSLMTVAAALVMLFLRPERLPDTAVTGPASTATVTAEISPENTLQPPASLARSGGSVISALPDGSAQLVPDAPSEETSSAIPPGLANIRIRVTPDGFSADGLLVVNCDLTSKAAQEGAFHKLLGEQQIAWEGGGGQPKAAAAPSEGVQVVYVEASGKQIEQLLASLNALPAAFPTVALVPTPGAAWQHQWQARYERHGHPAQTADSAADAEPSATGKKPRKGAPIKGPALKNEKNDTGEKRAEADSPGRAWSISLPSSRSESDDQADEIRNEDLALSTSTDQAAESAILRVLFVLRVLRGSSADPAAGSKAD